MPTNGISTASSKLIRGSTWSIIKIEGAATNQNRVEGKVTLYNSSDRSSDVNAWTAVRHGTDQWAITGQGARMSTGERVRSPFTYPFVLMKSVNDDVRAELSHWIRINGKALFKQGSELYDRRVHASSSGNGRLPSNGDLPLTDTLSSQQATAAVNATGRLEVIEVLVSEIQPFEGQPREEFTKSDLREIRESLRQEGQQQIIFVTPVSGVRGKRWELVDGERRYRGAVAAGIRTLTAVVKRFKNKDEQFWSSFTMNWNRRDHTPYENIRAVERAMKSGKTVAQIRTATGRSDCWVYQNLQLQNLDRSLRALMKQSVPKSDRMSFGIANRLSRVPRAEDQLRIWNVAKQQLTPSLRKLKVDQLTAVILDKLPQKGRKRKPSDNGVRILRCLQTAEADQTFISRTTEEDLRAFMMNTTMDFNRSDLLPRVRAVAAAWVELAKRVRKLK
ncbi:MAG: ParB/RepB/Spo0J family partition protein [Candidatus Paceibacterota bacterium]